MQGESSEMLEEGFVDGLQGLLEERVINSLEGVGYMSEEQEQELQVGSAREWLLESVKGCKWEKHAKQGLQAAKVGGTRVVRCKSRRSKGCGPGFRVRVRPG